MSGGVQVQGGCSTARSADAPHVLPLWCRQDRLAKERKVEDLKKKRKAATLSFSVEELEGESDDAPTPKGKAAPAPSALRAAVPVNGGDGAPMPSASGAASSTSGQKKAKFGKDPTVETSFLPDKDREAAEAQQRERLKLEWLQEQEKVKAERLTITYSYWDGSGHRRDITVPKGTTIGRFLELVRQVRQAAGALCVLRCPTPSCRSPYPQEISSEFPELRSVSAENLLYVKEDLIMPHVSLLTLLRVCA